jgi:uncharacterized damage-inducible protein DinB
MADSTLSTFYKGWEDYQGQLVKALAPLTPDQLALRADPALRQVGTIAAHIVGARTRWFLQAIGEGNQNLASMATWGRDGDPPHNAAELVYGLEATWQMIREALDRWTPEEFARPFQIERHGESHTFTRQWIIWHLIEHDLHHGGEISFSLGMHGVPALDL